MLKDERGITLLELLVALLIAVFLGGAIFNVFNLAVRSWQKGEARTQVYQNLRIALDRMSEEIRSAITLNKDYYPSGQKIYFNGTATQLNFISVAQAPIGNYYNSWASGLDDLKFDCCEIGYRHSGTTIYRRQQISGVPDDSTGSITSGGPEKELALHIKSLGFQYSPDGSSWQDTWDADPSVDDGLPKLVEIGITTESAVKRYPEVRTFVTYVYLP